MDDEKWKLSHFLGSAPRHQEYGNTFLIAQAKKARAGIAVKEKETKKAAEKEEKARKFRECVATNVQYARGRKRGRMESFSTCHNLFPSGYQSQQDYHRSLPPHLSPEPMLK